MMQSMTMFTITSLALAAGSCQVLKKDKAEVEKITHDAVDAAIDDISSDNIPIRKYRPPNSIVCLHYQF